MKPTRGFYLDHRLKLYTHLRPTEHDFFSERAIGSEPPVGTHPRSPEPDLQKPVEGRLQGLFFTLTHGVYAPQRSYCC